MVAFGVGELSGILNGLTLGTHLLEVALKFKVFIFALILLYGVTYWSNVVSRSDAIRSFADFMRIGVWFMWVVAVYVLFTQKVDNKLLFVETVLDERLVSEGIRVRVPGSRVPVELREGTVENVIPLKVPSVYLFLETVDAPVYLLSYYLTSNVDPVRWGAYAGNSLSPTKWWSKCFLESIANTDNFLEQKKIICYFLEDYYWKRASLWDYVLSNMSFYTYSPVPTWVKSFCGGVASGVPTTVKGIYERCISELAYNQERRINSLLAQLDADYSAGKIDETEYERRKEKLNALKDTVNKLFQELRHFEPVWSYYLGEILSKHPETLDRIRAVVSSGDGVSSQVVGAIRDTVETFAEWGANLFLGKTVLLTFVESLLKFLLTVELGIVFPTLVLLSALPEQGVLPFKTKNLTLALLSYLTIRAMRVAIFLVFLIAHNYFLSKGF